MIKHIENLFDILRSWVEYDISKQKKRLLA